MPATLDRSRHFCVIYGILDEDGAVFVQDGIRFSGDGVEVGRETADILAEPAPEEPVKRSRGRPKTIVETLEEPVETTEATDLL